MHTSPDSRKTPDAAKSVLALAKKLHRAAQSDGLSESLPVLRRLLNAGVLSGLALPQLHARRLQVQRKHVLRMLAIEAGSSSWEGYRRLLDAMTPAELIHFDMVRGVSGYPNLWFSSTREAEAYALQQGGRVLPVGSQAVVLPVAG